MIDARELRIGNWVIIKDANKNFDKEYKIQIEANHLSDIESSNYYAIGIPLTPDILEKAGFEVTIHFIGELKLEYIDYRSDGFVLFYLPEGLVEVEFWNEAIETINDRHYIGAWQSLHQLQNLFYALCGKELEIKL